MDLGWGVAKGRKSLSWGEAFCRFLPCPLHSDNHRWDDKGPK